MIDLLRKLPTYDYFIKFALDLFCTLRSALLQRELIYSATHAVYAESSIPTNKTKAIASKFQLLEPTHELKVYYFQYH